MSYQIKRALRDLVKTFIPDTVVYDHITLPAKHFRLCGQEFRDDAFYLQSAELEANRLVEHFDLSLQSRVLDVGCGVGRLAIGIMKDVGDIQNYTGIDVMQRPIAWCQKHIGQLHPTFHFMHIDVDNPLYNPTGKAIGSQFRLPFTDHSFDIVYLYSVFSHMTTEHVQAYLGEFHRILSPAGVSSLQHLSRKMCLI